MARLFLLFLVPLLVFVSDAFALDSAVVELFSPQGVVKNVRQVTARFSEPMVSFGDPRLADPFDADCPEKGKGRWIDAKTWSFDFERDLPAGLVCRFSRKPGLKSLAGREVTGEASFSFSTGGPSVISSLPDDGDESIDERQAFVLFLDAEPDADSVTSRASCSVEGIRERVGVRILEGDEKEEILRTVPSWRMEEMQGGGRQTLVLQCRQTFPPKAAVKLLWGKGIRSRSGIETTEDQLLSFRAREPFSAGFHCLREKAGSDCIPLTYMALTFTAPVPYDLAHQILLKGGDGRIWKPKKSEEQEAEGYLTRLVFDGPFPELSGLSLSIPKGLRDDSGRELANSDEFPMTVKTASYPPLAKFSSRFGIIELREGAVLPVTVRNLEAEMRLWLKDLGEKVPEKPKDRSDGLKGSLRYLGTDQEERIIQWLRSLASAQREKPLLAAKAEAKKLSFPLPEGGKAFEVIGIPLSSPGFYLAEIESQALGARLLNKKAPMYVPAGALVTNMAAHFRWGKESSLVWVTTLDKGQMVPGADVALRDCNGKEVWKGETDSRGIALIKKALPDEGDLPHCRSEINYAEASPSLSGIGGGLFIFARTKEDMTFTHSSWEDGIEPWRFNLPGSQGEESGSIAHTILDRSLLRAGETVHMKHVMRRQTTSGFGLIPPSDLPGEVVVEHTGSEQSYSFPLSWTAQGTAETDWKIPEGARLGVYQISLRKKLRPASKEEEEQERNWSSGSFRVEEFRVPLMRAVIQPPKEQLIRPKEIDLDLFISYLSGGGASNLPVKVRSELQPKGISLPDYEGYIFSNGPVREGVERISGGDEEGGQEERRTRLQTMDVSLDRAGASRVRIAGIPEVDEPKDLITETEFRDPNGEVQTASSRIPLYPSPWLIGIMTADWAASQEGLRYTVAVLDLKGAPVKGADVVVKLLQEKSYSHRRRVTGGFYAYEHIREVKPLGEHCRGRTDDKGLLFCEAKSPVSGSVVLQAEAKDSLNNTASAHAEVWAAGKGEWWFEVANDDRIDLIPEKKRYEPGETARFQVRMPYKEATALVTVEREGIMESSVVTINRQRPVVEIPVKGNYAPNCFVSVLVVRGRVTDQAPTATFDPGRPAFKLGIAEIQVGWKAHELKVKVSTERETYRVREKAVVTIQARTLQGTPPPKGTEVAVAAVDEGLLELMPNASWRLLEGMMARRGYGMRTSTAQMMVVGKRHFGKKALPAGGGGGRQITRELFDTLLYWKGKVVLNDKGEATVEIPLNDSLTSFRIVAVALSGPGLFGTGQASVRTTQDLMILTGLPPVVREGDRFRAGFTVRNTTKRAMTVDLELNVKGVMTEKAAETIAAGEAREIGWDVTVPQGVSSLRYDLSAGERNGTSRDSLSVNQRVARAVPVRTFQATLLQVKESLTIPVESPSDAIAGTGGVSVSLKPRLSEGLAGVSRYMRDYPYTCMEQKVSRAVALRDRGIWEKIVAELPSHTDKDGLVKYFPTMDSGSDVLTSYLLSISHEAGYSIPEDLRNTMLEGLKGFVEGKVKRSSSLSAADLTLRRLSALEALSRYGTAEPGMVISIAIEPNLWPTSAVLDWMQTLGRMTGIPERDRRLREAETILRSRMNLQGSTMNLTTERTDNLWWLMTTPDTNAVRSLLTVLPRQGWQEDVPRMARGLIGRMRRGHWDTTTANAWGVLAMERFSRTFEQSPVSGITIVSLEAQTDSVEWGKTKAGRDLSLNRPVKRDDLQIIHKGTGRPWATVQSRAAIPLKEPFSSGYGITKRIIPVEQRVKGRWSRGDVVRVHLDIQAQADMTWVALTDPIPSGATILGGGLRRGSLLAEGEKREGWVEEAFRERSLEAFRAYYAFVPKGGWTVEYTMRLNNEGRFRLPETRAEALYAPEMMGEIPNTVMEVRP